MRDLPSLCARLAVSSARQSRAPYARKWALPSALALAAGLIMGAPAGAQSFSDLLKSVAGKVKGADSVQSVLQQITSITTPTLSKRDDTLGTAAGDQVIFYSASWCGYCKQARAYMQSKNVPFTEYDVEKTEKGKADLKALNAPGVPVLLLGDQKLMGFQPAQFDAAYTKFQASDRHAQAAAVPVAAGAPGAVGASGAVGAGGAVAAAGAAGVVGAGNAGGPGFEAGSVLSPKIAGVRVFGQAATDGAPIFILAKADEVVYLGEARDGFLKVQGSAGAGWVQSVLMKK